MVLNLAFNNYEKQQWYRTEVIALMLVRLGYFVILAALKRFETFTTAHGFVSTFA